MVNGGLRHERDVRTNLMNRVSIVVITVAFDPEGREKYLDNPERSEVPLIWRALECLVQLSCQAGSHDEIGSLDISRRLRP